MQRLKKKLTLIFFYYLKNPEKLLVHFAYKNVFNI